MTPQGTRFRVWAPEADTVAVVLFEHGTPGRPHAMQREQQGFWETTITGVGAGARYAYSVNGDDPRPDPASRSQPDGVHAPSEVIDPAGFEWHDAAWRGIPLDDMIIYETHVGTATDSGTFDSLIDRLGYFRDLGVTAIEIMPVADFPGARNWGYDGVNLYAPANAYGGPEAFKRLIDAAHRLGLAIILDVVYNHFGPDGNYLRVFSPYYFTDRHHTPWGDALNLDGPNSDAARQYLIDNALYWAHEYHVDGLRMDATHALIDDSDEHFIRQLTQTVHASLADDRQFVIFVEDDRNEEQLATVVERGGFGVDGMWADDFHHAARIAVTGERGGYYNDYSGSAEDLATTIADGWLYQGQVSPTQHHQRGTNPRSLAYPQFVYCIQNHDQVGNRPLGDRLNHVVDAATYRAMSALLLLVPETPLLFQGQEWAASTPFLFFTDHNPELGKLVTEGRRREFAYFAAASGETVPDPQAETTFTASRLRWDELAQPEHATIHALYRDLLALRRSHPALRRRDRASVQVAPIAERAIAITREGPQPSQSLTIVVNLRGSILWQLPHSASILLDTNAPQYGGDQPATLSGSSLSLAVPGAVILQHS